MSLDVFEGREGSSEKRDDGKGPGTGGGREGGGGGNQGGGHIKWRVKMPAPSECHERAARDEAIDKQHTSSS